jgi:hypothetical protein
MYILLHNKFFSSFLEERGKGVGFSLSAAASSRLINGAKVLPNLQHIELIESCQKQIDTAAHALQHVKLEVQLFSPTEFEFLFNLLIKKCFKSKIQMLFCSDFAKARSDRRSQACIVRAWSVSFARCRFIYSLHLIFLGTEAFVFDQPSSTEDQESLRAQLACLRISKLFRYYNPVSAAYSS